MNEKKAKELLTRYLLGELDDATRAEVEAFLERSESCRAEARKIEPTLDLLCSALAAPDQTPERLSPERKARIMQSAAAPGDAHKAARRNVLHWFTDGWPGIARTAALLLVCFVIAGLLLPATLSSRSMYREPAARIGFDISPAPGEATLENRVDHLYDDMSLADLDHEQTERLPAGWRYAGKPGGERSAPRDENGSVMSRALDPNADASWSRRGGVKLAPSSGDEDFYFDSDGDGLANGGSLRFTARHDSSGAAVPDAVEPVNADIEELDAVAIVKSPIIMRGIYGSRTPAKSDSAATSTKSDKTKNEVTSVNVVGYNKMEIPDDGFGRAAVDVDFSEVAAGTAVKESGKPAKTKSLPKAKTGSGTENSVPAPAIRPVLSPRSEPAARPVAPPTRTVPASPREEAPAGGAAYAGKRIDVNGGVNYFNGEVGQERLRRGVESSRAPLRQDVSDETAPAPKREMVPLELKLPKPSFTGTPMKIKSDNLEKRSYAGQKLEATAEPPPTTAQSRGTAAKPPARTPRWNERESVDEAELKTTLKRGHESFAWSDSGAPQTHFEGALEKDPGNTEAARMLDKVAAKGLGETATKQNQTRKDMFSETVDRRKATDRKISPPPPALITPEPHDALKMYAESADTPAQPQSGLTLGPDTGEAGRRWQKAGEDAVPALGQVPVLGQLFGAESRGKEKKRLAEPGPNVTVASATVTGGQDRPDSADVKLRVEEERRRGEAASLGGYAGGSARVSHSVNSEIVHAPRGKDVATIVRDHDDDYVAHIADGRKLLTDKEAGGEESPVAGERVADPMALGLKETGKGRHERKERYSREEQGAEREGLEASLSKTHRQRDAKPGAQAHVVEEVLDEWHGKLQDEKSVDRNGREGRPAPGAATELALIELKEEAEGEPEPEPEDPTRFRAFGVNPFYVAKDQAFSTFSIDVDTASYALARRYMSQGFLPPAEAVRTEEFVNFFDYGYKAPLHRTFRVYTESAPSRFGRGLHLVKVGVKGRRLGREEQRRAVLTFLIDTSGSMDKPDRLGLVQQSLRLLVSKLNPDDCVAIVQYASHARVLIEHTSVRDKKKILAAIDALQCGGSTNLGEGMQRAYQLAAAAFVPGGENRVLLLSDGVANLGTGDATDILKQVERYRKQGITCSVFGFGMGTYDDEMLETLANKGDGNYTFIDSREQAQRVFVDDLAATLNTIAADVKIQVEFDPKRVKRYRQLGYENRQLAKQDFRNDSVDAGEIGSGQSVTALYEVELVNTTSRAPICTVRVRYRRVDTGAVEEIENVLKPSNMVARFPEADSRFRLAVCVAEFAEILRGSPYASGSEYHDVATALRPVALELDLDHRVQELLRLVQGAESMSRGK